MRCRRHGGQNGFWERRHVVVHGCVDSDMFGRRAILAQGIVDGRATHSHGRLLMSRQEGNWGFVQASSGIDVNCVGDVLCWLANIC